MTGPRYLLVDVETSPNLVWTFELKRAYVGIESIVEPSRMLCFAACWLDKSDEIIFSSEWDHGHEGMMATLYRLVSEADVVIHFNGERFDELKMNQEWAQLGWGPPAPFQRIDLWRAVSKRFDLPSQKLDYVLRHFGLGGKQSTGGMKLWVGVMAGDAQSRRKMEEYNRNDVAIMVPLYYKLRPWIPGHPNATLYEPSTDTALHCRVCDSDDVQRRGYSYTDASRYQRFRCNKCQSWSKVPSRDMGSDLRAA